MIHVVDFVEAFLPFVSNLMEPQCRDLLYAVIILVSNKFFHRRVRGGVGCLRD